MPYSFAPFGRTGARLSVRSTYPDSDPRGRFYGQRQAALARRQASIASLRAAGPAMMAIPNPRNPEVKFFDCVPTAPAAGLLAIANVAGAEPTSAYTGMTELNAISQGAGAYQRIGQKVVIKSLALKLQLALIEGATTTITNTARVMIIYDRQSNGNFPAIADILSTNVSSAPVFTSGLNMAKKNRFSIIADRYYDLSTGGDGAATVTIFRNNLNLEVEYGANNGLISDIGTGAIYFVAFAQSQTAAYEIVPQSMTSRVRFYDS